jgi:hypothetical protein
MSTKPFCGNPMCEYHRVAISSFSDPNTIKIKRRGKNELLRRITYRLISEEGMKLFQEDLCDVCGNVIDMIDPESSKPGL